MRLIAAVPARLVVARNSISCPACRAWLALAKTRSKPCAGALEDAVAGVVHEVGVVAPVAVERVGAAAAVQHVGAGVADEPVGEGVAGEVDGRRQRRVGGGERLHLWPAWSAWLTLANTTSAPPPAPSKTRSPALST